MLEYPRERELTLNREKCQSRMPQLIFMGKVLSEHGVGPTEAKFEAVSKARELETSSEVRSFLGLVIYNGHFIPNLTTTAEPLRRLTRKDTPFEWGKTEQEAFDKLQKDLANAHTLGYFDKNAATQVIADAGPVGLGAVVVQRQRGESRVISYASRSLTDGEGGASTCVGVREIPPVLVWNQVQTGHRLQSIGDYILNQSIKQTSIAPISPAKPGSVARQPNQCSTAKSRKQFRNINRPWRVTVSMRERPNQSKVKTVSSNRAMGAETTALRLQCEIHSRADKHGRHFV